MSVCPYCEELGDCLCDVCEDKITQSYREKIANLERQLAEAVHDIEVYRDALGYPMRIDHDGKLTDGTVPENEIAADAVRRLAEAQAHVRNHHIEACVSCAATESERDALKVAVEQAREALERAHNCATLNSQTRKCEGCFVSDALAALDEGKEAGG